MTDKFIPIHSYDESFALGIFDSREKAEEAYTMFIENHDYETLKEDCFNQTGKILDIFTDDDDIIEFLDQHKIGCAIVSGDSVENFDFVKDYEPWVHGFGGENHLANLLVAIKQNKEFKLNSVGELAMKYQATNHPIF